MNYDADSVPYVVVCDTAMQYERGESVPLCHNAHIFTLISPWLETDVYEL